MSPTGLKWVGVAPHSVVEPPRLFVQLLDNKYQTPMTSNVLIRMRVFDEIGAFEESFRGMYEDQAFFMKLCLREKVYVSDARWAKYRQHADSHCARVEKGRAAESLRRPLLDWIARYVREQGIAEPAALIALERALYPYQRPRRYRAERFVRRCVSSTKTRLSVWKRNAAAVRQERR